MRRINLGWALLVVIAGGAGCSVLPAVRMPVEEPSFQASRISPARWALVLSSGAMRGFAHIGALRELEKAGLRPDLIVGASAGAIVGALSASGMSGSEMASAARGMDFFGVWALPVTGFLGGSGIHRSVDAHAHAHRIEDFPTRFAAVAVEAERGCLQVFNSGDVGTAVQASSSVPVLLVPPVIGGRRFLDGGLASPVPVRVARLLGAERVVAIDVTFDPAERPFLNIADAFWRSTLVMQRALAVVEGMEADLLIAPRLPPESAIAFENRDAIGEAGALAVRLALPDLRALLASGPPHPGGRATFPPQLLCAPSL